MSGSSDRRAQDPDRVAPAVATMRRELEKFLEAEDASGRKPNNAECGVYVFYDYDGEPIYVGQTQEQLRKRMRRHLTNWRTDAVAMNVLDPFEVADIEVYPFYDLKTPRAGESGKDHKQRVDLTLDRAEYTVYRKVLEESALGAVLNEKEIKVREPVELPKPFRGRIVPDETYELNKHPDTRIARRAKTISELARVVSERKVSPGLRRALLVQARRLELLAARRLEELGIAVSAEEPAEETEEAEGVYGSAR